VLHDGQVIGAWLLDRDKSSGSTTLTVHHGHTLSAAAQGDLEAEARRLLGLVAADAQAHEVRFTPVPR
jgi:hypothetical protein